MTHESSKAEYSSPKLLKGVLLAFTLRAMGAACAFALNVVIGRLLGAEGAGLYYLALSVSSIVAVIARLGMDHAALRLIAAEIANEDNGERASSVLVQAIKVTGASALTMSLIILVTAHPISTHVLSEPSLVGPLSWISMSILTFSMMMLMAESLKGLSRVRDAMLVSGVIYPVVALIFIWPLTKLAGASGAALAYVLGTGVAATIGLVLWLRQRSLPWVNPDFELSALWISSGRLWVMSIINSAVLPWTPLFLLGVWGSTEDAGIFGAATKLATLITFSLAAVNAVAAPRFSRLYAQGRIEELRSAACRSSLFVAVLASPVLVLMVFESDWLMGLFGEDFVRGGTLLTILALGQAVSALTGSVGYLLMMTGHEKDIRNSAILSALILGASSVVLIPPYGPLGAAISGAIAMSSSNVTNYVLVKLRLGFFVVPK